METSKLEGLFGTSRNSTIRTDIQFSFTSCALNAVLDWRDGYNSEDHIVVKGVKIIAAEAAIIGLTLVGLIETVARAILATVVKLVDLILPKTCLSKVSKYLISTTLISAMVTNMAIVELVTNFLPQDTEMEVGEKINDFYQDVGNGCFLPLAKFRLIK